MIVSCPCRTATMNLYAGKMRQGCAIGLKNYRHCGKESKMAEFQKVVKEYRRMCSSTEDCTRCPLMELVNGSATYCEAGVLHSSEEAEDIIMQWSSEHPIMTNRMKFEEIFGCGIVTHEIHEAIPGHVEILNTSDEEFEEWLNAEYKGRQDG